MAGHKPIWAASGIVRSPLGASTRGAASCRRMSSEAWHLDFVISSFEELYAPGKCLEPDCQRLTLGVEFPPAGDWVVSVCLKVILPGARQARLQTDLCLLLWVPSGMSSWGLSPVYLLVTSKVWRERIFLLATKKRVPVLSQGEVST